MVCRLFGTRPLSKPMRSYCQLYSKEQTNSEIVIKIQNFSFTKMHLKISSEKWPPFCPGGDELTSNMAKIAMYPRIDNYCFGSHLPNIIKGMANEINLTILQCYIEYRKLHVHDAYQNK